MALARKEIQVVDAQGNVQAGASVTVRRETVGQPLEPLYSDRDGATPIGNPVTADANGVAAFHCLGGAFQIVATLGAFSRTQRYVPMGTAAEGDIDDLVANNAAGISYTPVDSPGIGNTVQDAIDALDTDKQDAATALTQGRHTIWVPAGAMVARSANGALASTTVMGTATYATLDFDPDSIEHAQFVIAMPKSWDEGTVTFVPVWSHAATTVNFGVVWQLRGQAISDGDSGNVGLSGQQGSTDTGGTTDDIYQGPESAAITIAGTPAADDVVLFEIFRNATSGSDTLAVDARLHGIKLFFTINAGNDA